MNDAAVIDATRRWIQAVVIDFNLCPFAERVFAAGQIRYVVTHADSESALRDALNAELQYLVAMPSEKVETTLLIHPNVLLDFLDYNDFLSRAERQVKKLSMVGVIQIASFHPQYQFDGTEPDDVENYTNRSPYAMLHLLREESVTRAVDSLNDPDEVPTRNIETMKRLGREKIEALLKNCLVGWALPTDPASDLTTG